MTYLTLVIVLHPKFQIRLTLCWTILNNLNFISSWRLRFVEERRSWRPFDRHWRITATELISHRQTFCSTATMVMAKAKQPLIKAMVLALEKYPVIWDKNDPEFKINYLKQVAWAKVHAELKSKVRSHTPTLSISLWYFPKYFLFFSPRHRFRVAIFNSTLVEWSFIIELCILLIPVLNHRIKEYFSFPKDRNGFHFIEPTFL